MNALQRVLPLHATARIRRWLGLAALALLPLLTAPVARADAVRLIFAGDVMLDDGPGRLIAAGGDPLHPFALVLAEADYRIANLECSVSTLGAPIPDKIYTFRAAPATLRVLDGRFDALALANNHSGDYGPEAFLDTLQRLEGAGFAAFGGGRNLHEAHRPLWIDRKGLRIAVLAYNEYKPRAFEAGPRHPGVAWSEDEDVVADIRAARAAGADLVIPFMHWGWEQEPEPGLRQRSLARRMIDAGADLVVGGHPHVTQGAEYYKGRLIVYSLGNFVFDGFDDQPAARRGWLLRLTLDKGGLLHWDTLEARMDDDGTPWPVSGVLTPCGRAGDKVVGLCRNP
ncbi:CapA family protein [Zoogloea sp.]|uniref:CapA family protein n=1 Tax=Zoogloea sp. TaxID=49181 RepID=UPI0035B490AE